MNDEPNEAVVDAWIALLTAQDASLNYVEKCFKQNGLPPFAWYDVLWELECASKIGLRPYILEQRTLITQYGLSRLLNRLEKDGYITKKACLDDGRGHTIMITTQGRQIRRKMWAIYSKAIQTVMGDKLTTAQCRQLSKLLKPLQPQKVL